MARRGGEKLAPFIPVLKATMKSPAWLDLSLGARWLYVHLRGRADNHASNNGQIFLSYRDAAEEIGCHRNAIGRWYVELETHGFIVATARASLGTDGRGQASRWRLTELAFQGQPPTRDFIKWPDIPAAKNKIPSHGVCQAVTPDVPPLSHGVCHPVTQRVTDSPDFAGGLSHEV